jgi:predicted MFS family arabinose efflux permease
MTAVHESRDPDARRLDVPGMLLFGVGLFCLVWALISTNTDGWTSRPTQFKFAAGFILFVLFTIAERLQKRPMVDFGLFRKRTFLGSAIAMFGFASAAQVMMTYLPLYLQNNFGQSPAAAGLAMLPFALPLFFCPRIGAALAQRISGRALLTIGLLIVALGNFTTALAAAATMPYSVIAIGIFVTGCGAGLLNGETTKVSMSVIPPERSGMASGIGATLRFAGLVTGITALGAILASRTEQRFLMSVPGNVLEGNAHFLVSRIVAGDIPGVLTQIAEPSRAAMLLAARGSFASGFTIVLFAAAFVAVLAAGLTWVFVSAIDTAPTHAPAAAQATLNTIPD